MTLLRETLGRVQAIISPSRFLKEVFVGTGIGAERIRFMRQGRDFPGLGQNVLQKTPSEHLRIGYMGQITPHKGVHTLIEAVGQVSDVDMEVKVYGDPTPFPDYAQRLRRLVRHDPRVSLEGVYQRHDVSRVLQGLDVVVVPSLWYENSPNTILEAFAHHTPVIVSDLGGMAELVNDGVNGMRFAAGDATGLALKLRQLVDRPELLDRLRTGIGPVKSVAQEIDELVAIYQIVAGNGSIPGEQSR
jgi:glycosyltransferase involved in cell wall biosynthesis